MALPLAVAIFSNGFFRNLSTTLKSSAFWLIAAFYTLHLAGYFYSLDKHTASQYLLLRSPLLVLPLALFVRPFSKAERIEVLKGFVSITLVAFSVSVCYSGLIAFQKNDSQWIYNDNLVTLLQMQAVYASLYVVFCAIATFYLWREKVLKTTVLVGVLVFCFVFSFLLASRMGLAALAGTSLVYFIFSQQKVSVLKVISISAIVVLLFLGLGVLFPKTVNRFVNLDNAKYDFESEASLYHFNETPGTENWNGLNVRLSLWHAGWLSAQERPLFGAGTGGHFVALNQVYEQLNFKLALQHKFGTHNQYLQVLVMFGVVGIAVFLLYLGQWFKMAMSLKSLAGVLCILSLCLAFVTEDFLSRAQGVALAAVFTSVFALPVKEEHFPKTD